MLKASDDQPIPDLRSLLQPFELGGTTLSNRFVMAPMTRGQSPNGTPDRRVVDYYRRRAEGGVGLLITEGSYIDHPTAGENPSVPRIAADTVSAWRAVTTAVHEAGARIFSQLWHLGAQAKPSPGSTIPIISPSGVDLDGRPVGNPADEALIGELKDAYVRSAICARDAGFDGVEVHAAHGYLIDQFMWSQTNRRTDSYGGSISNRTRLAADIVAAIKAELGEQFPVSLRFSNWKVNHYDAALVDNATDLAVFLRPLVDAGVDIFHVSTRRFWEPAFHGSNRTLAGWTRKLSGRPVILVGSIGLNGAFTPGSSIEGAAEATRLGTLADLFAAGEFDLAAIGRALISDPNWVLKATDGGQPEHVDFNHTMLQEYV